MAARDIIVIGAGVAGLTAARALREQGLAVTVLERARGVGGRCATRRVAGQPVDHGLAFLHGSDSRLLEEVGSLRGAPTVPWPQRIHGRGGPCQPRAFERPEERTAIAEGVSRFAKHLAAGTEVALETRVTGLALSPDRSHWTVASEAGATLEARAVVLAMPIAQARRLFDPVCDGWAELRSLLPLLELPQSAACVTVIARYPAGRAGPDWDLWLPEESSAIQSVFHDSAKRGPDATLTLVVQARPAWSRVALDDVSESLADELLADAGRGLGAWARRPEVRQLHLWKHARVHATSELAAPLIVPTGAGSWLGLCGDAFDKAGGVEGAYRSGLAMAERLSAALAGAPSLRRSP